MIFISVQNDQVPMIFIKKKYIYIHACARIALLSNDQRIKDYLLFVIHSSARNSRNNARHGRAGMYISCHLCFIPGIGIEIFMLATE